MDQWISIVIVLAEDLGLEPPSTRQLTTIDNSSYRGPNVLFWPPWMLTHTCMHTHMQAHTHLKQILKEMN